MLQDPKPLIIQLQPHAAHSTNWLDVFFGAMGIAGALFVLAIVLGCLVAGFLVYRHRRHPPEADRLPSVSPLIPPPPSLGSTRPQ